VPFIRVPFSFSFRFSSLFVSSLFGQETLKRFPVVAVAIELHPQREPPQVTSSLHQLERDGYALRYLNYDGGITATDRADAKARPAR
jgi:hypothetical protein